MRVLLGCRLLHDAVSRDVLAIAIFFVLSRQAGTDSLNLHVYMFFKTIFRPFAAPGKCRPVRTAPLSLRHCSVISNIAMLR